MRKSVKCGLAGETNSYFKGLCDRERTARKTMVTIDREWRYESEVRCVAVDRRPSADAAVFGSNLATAARSVPASGPPLSPGGTEVSVQHSAGVSRPAPLFYVSSQPVDFEVPAGASMGTATVSISSGSGAISTGSIRISNVAPGLFCAKGNGQGVAFHIQPKAGTLTPSGIGAWAFLTFSNWQALVEHAQSVVKNSGFANPVYPADDYSLPGGSPEAGFVVFDPTQAGRSNPALAASPVPATFPTAPFNSATDF